MKKIKVKHKLARTLKLAKKHKLIAVAIVLSSLIGIISILSFSYIKIAKAVSTPESCFDFDAINGTIQAYYTNENNDIMQPACSRDVDIPATISGIPVTTIGIGAFQGDSLTSVVIPSSVTAIQQYAFETNQLSSVVIPNSVTSLGMYAFSNNTLTSITLSTSLATIEEYTFHNNAITSLTIPNSVTTIGMHAFSNNDIAALVIPGSVTNIDEAAFFDNKLASLSLPNSLTTISKEVFRLNKLTSLTIPNSVTSIGEIAFDSNELASVTIPNSVTNIGVGAFEFNKLTSVTIPSSVTTIETSAFMSNRLTSVSLPNTITSIGIRAFSANLLTSISIPNSVTIIDEYAFLGNKLTSVTIPSSVTNVGLMAFAFNDLQSVTMEGTATLGLYVFSASGVDITDFFQTAIDNPVGLGAFMTANTKYVPLYTSNPSNPAGYTDTDYRTQYIAINGVPPADTDGVIGGHIVNPSQITISYKDTNNNSIKAPDIYVGPSLSDYKISSNPGANFGLYYHKGDTATLTAPDTISDLTRQSQSPYSYLLAVGSNNHTFSYVSSTGSSGGGNNTNNNNISIPIQPITTIKSGTKSNTSPNSGAKQRNMAIFTVILLAGLSVIGLLTVQVYIVRKTHTNINIK